MQGVCQQSSDDILRYCVVTSKPPLAFSGKVGLTLGKVGLTQLLAKAKSLEI